MSCHLLFKTSLRATCKTLPSFLPLLKIFHFFPVFSCCLHPIPSVSDFFHITHFVRFNTYPSHPLKVIPILVKVDEVPVEGPGEHDVQGVVVGHLAGQDDALPHCDIHAERGHHHPRWICEQQRKEEKKGFFLFS